MKPEFSVISGRVVHDIVWHDLGRCLDVVRRAYLAHDKAQTINPNSYFLRFPNEPANRIIALPASIDADFGVSGLKWIASYPGNLKRGLPRASATLVLNQRDTGYPFAVLESSIISAARTAASAALAAGCLMTQPRPHKLAIIGTGLIARYVYKFLLDSGLGLDFAQVQLFDSVAAEAERFANAVCSRERHRSVTVAASLEQAVRASDLVVFTTTAGAPYVTDVSLLEHNPVLLHLSLRDLAPELILSALNFTDDIGHVLNAGTSLHLTEQAVGHRGFIAGTLGDLLEQRVPVPHDKPRIFSPFGLGVLDLAVGKWVFDEAKRSQRLQPVQDFFYDLQR